MPKFGLFIPPKGEQKKHAYHSFLEKKIGSTFAPFEQSQSIQLAASLLLLIASIIAILWASLPSLNNYYFYIVNLNLNIQAGNFNFIVPLKFIVNEVLLTGFFFLVGLEIKRELLAGELQNYKFAYLVLCAAIGGMLIPALLYVLINLNETSVNGWGIPMATDTAIALGLLTCFRNFLPKGIFTFIAAMAIIDDIGTILVMIIHYNNQVDLFYIEIALFFILSLITLNFLGFRGPVPYLIFGMAVFICVEFSGIHGAISGILVALTVPARPATGPKYLTRQVKNIIHRFEKNNHDLPKVLEDNNQHKALTAIVKTVESATTPLQRWQSKLDKPVILLILPLFAFFNAGISLNFDLFNEVFVSKISLGIMIGLIFGKPFGISLLTYFALKLKIGELPEHVSFFQIVCTSFLGGIGFTMSLFIATLTFSSSEYLFSLVKLSVILSSIFSTIIGTVALLAYSREFYKKHHNKDEFTIGLDT